ncbi:hypothetical protein FGO68_gene9318 [Halteria grandinella]|uniref:Uncharacterized protein n=1 Tax=Halteria grandinella TaxID=5974 RepID=A0A8J8P2W6_HALGN|nr:hypothetical protein FGO68_gene9318 [Halteria grandinella]
MEDIEETSALIKQQKEVASSRRSSILVAKSARDETFMQAILGLVCPYLSIKGFCMVHNRGWNQQRKLPIYKPHRPDRPR